jgi:hypothetical protein
MSVVLQRERELNQLAMQKETEIASPKIQRGKLEEERKSLAGQEQHECECQSVQRTDLLRRS